MSKYWLMGAIALIAFLVAVVWIWRSLAVLSLP